MMIFGFPDVIFGEKGLEVDTYNPPNLFDYIAHKCSTRSVLTKGAQRAKIDVQNRCWVFDHTSAPCWSILRAKGVPPPTPKSIKNQTEIVPERVVFLDLVFKCFLFFHFLKGGIL